MAVPDEEPGVFQVWSQMDLSGAADEGSTGTWEVRVFLDDGLTPAAVFTFEVE
jgi:hypothetical protein